MHKIILIRHGESLGNVNDQYYNLPDCANILTVKGVDQCIDLSKKISLHLEEDFHWTQTTVISSKYQRAKLTAQIVMSGVATNKHLPILEDSRINECVYTTDGNPLESTEGMVERFRWCVESHPFNLILFTHGHIMSAIAGKDKKEVNNCECWVFGRAELLKILRERN